MKRKEGEDEKQRRLKSFSLKHEMRIGGFFYTLVHKISDPSPPKKAPPLLSDLVAPPCVCGGVRAALVDTKQTKNLETGDSLRCRSLCSLRVLLLSVSSVFL